MCNKNVFHASHATSTALSPNRDVKRLFEKTYCNQQHNDSNNHRRHRCHHHCCCHHSSSISLLSHFYQCYHYDFQPHSRRMIHLFTTILMTCTSCDIMCSQTKCGFTSNVLLVIFVPMLRTGHLLGQDFVRLLWSGLEVISWPNSEGSLGWWWRQCAEECWTWQIF